MNAKQAKKLRRISQLFNKTSIGEDKAYKALKKSYKKTWRERYAQNGNRELG